MSTNVKRLRIAQHDPRHWEVPLAYPEHVERDGEPGSVLVVVGVSGTT
jgi:hypothetical protein